MTHIICGDKQVDSSPHPCSATPVARALLVRLIVEIINNTGFKIEPLKIFQGTLV